MGKQESVTLDEGNLRMDGRSGDGEPAGDGQSPGVTRGIARPLDRPLPLPEPGATARHHDLGRGDCRRSGDHRHRQHVRGRGQGSHASPGASLHAPGSRQGSGGHISLAGFAGKPLIINFFASWCEPCQKETPLLARFYRAAHGSVTLIGIDANDKASAALKFIHAAGVSYPVAFDPYPMHTTISFGVDALPQTFFLDARHRIVKLVRGAVTEQELRAGVAQITGQTRG